MNQAIAILKSGRSFAEASEITGIPVDEIMKEWDKLNKNEEFKIPQLITPRGQCNGQ